MNPEPKVTPVKQPSSEDVAKLYRDHPGRYMNGIKDALHLCPGNLSRVHLERWARNPTDDPLTAAQVEFLWEWTRGYFAISNATGEYIRVRKEPAPARVLPVRGDPLDPKNKRLMEFVNKSYQPGTGVANGGMQPGTRKGSDIIDAEERLMAARKRADREADEAKAKARQANGHKPSVVQSLMSFGKVK